jgi:hypothetical protein
MEQYKTLVKTNKFIGNFPVTLTDHSFNKKTVYYYTPKIDGLRKLVLFTEDKVISFTTKMEISEIKFTKNSNKVAGSLIDCELYKGKYYAFDILFSNNIDFRKKNLHSRLQELHNLISIVNSKKIIEKKYTKLKCPEFINEINKNEKKFKNGELDGFILTPNYEYSSIVLKWKPHYLLSIDFEIKNDGDYLILLLQNKTPFEPKCCPGISRVKYPPNFDKFKDGDIVEFTYNSGSFEILRARPDKVKSNHISVIMDNFKELRNPTDITKILC